MRKEVKENKIYLYGEINEIVDEITSPEQKALK